MGYSTDKVIGQAPKPVLKPVQTTETPGFRGAVTTAETVARGTFRDVTRKGPDGKPVFGQENTLTGEFKPYPKELQPAAQPKITPQELAEARSDALRRAYLAKEIERSSREDFFATGFLAPTAAGFGGSAAATVQQNIEALKAGGALQTLLNMARQTGKNLLTPLSNSDVQLLSNAKQLPLEISMRDKDFQKNARQYFDANKRAYIAAGGKASEFNTEIMRLTGRANAGARANAGVKVERVR